MGEVESRAKKSVTRCHTLKDQLKKVSTLRLETKQDFYSI